MGNFKVNTLASPSNYFINKLKHFNFGKNVNCQTWQKSCESVKLSSAFWNKTCIVVWTEVSLWNRTCSRAF